MGAIRFGAPREMISWMRNTFDVRHFVETGTNRAETAVWAAGVFDRVVTIEGYAPLHAAAVAEYGHLGNIEFLHGDSRDLLAGALASLGGPAVVWLDAHWCGEQTFGVEAECPVIEEIRTVNASAPGHFVLVDDARLFLAPPPPPHKAEDWPDLPALCDALREGHDRFIAVHEDVLMGVPASARAEVVEYLRQAARPPEPTPRPVLKRIASRLRRVPQ